MKNRHNFKKKYGQNFLEDNELLKKIEDIINLKKSDKVIEIGPGLGYLTSMLLKNAKSVCAYEIDDELIPKLLNKFKEYDNFKLIHEDFMQSTISEENVKIVANIPYYITSPIIQKLVDNRDKIDEVYLMVQKEVAIRICTDKDVSILTHSVNFYCETEYLFTVPKTLFVPKPKVDSAFIRLKFRKDKKYENMISDKTYFSFLKLAFANKRKTLFNNLKGSIDKSILEKYVSSKVRAEQLSIDKFILIIRELNYEWVWIYFASW